MNIMNNSTTPKVSIGLPVYNAEKYLKTAVDSILSQTYSDFELIICDNASTDETQCICAAYEASDSRVKYHRNEKNIGAAGNFNLTYKLATGEYFRWAADDDLMEPTCLEKCVDILDHHPEALIAHTKVKVIDEEGHVVKFYDDMLDIRSGSPSQRFRHYLFRPVRMWNAIFGLVRASEFGKTTLLGGYAMADQPLLGELILRGRIYQVPEYLFQRRMHEGQSWQANTNNRSLSEWFDPTNKDKLLLPARLKLFKEYLTAVSRVPMPLSERLTCYLYAFRWGGKRVLWRPIKLKFFNGRNIISGSAR